MPFTGAVCTAKPRLAQWQSAMGAMASIRNRRIRLRPRTGHDRRRLEHGVSPRDALHAAIMRSNRIIDRILSFDRVFDAVAETGRLRSKI